MSFRWLFRDYGTPGDAQERMASRGERSGMTGKIDKTWGPALSKKYSYVLNSPAMNPAAASLPTPAALRRLPPLLRRAWYGLNQSFRQRIAHIEITPDQYSILRWLNEGDPLGLTQRQLTDLMASDPNTITSTLSRMETAGLISRHPHETDRRAHRVRLEKPGKNALKKALRIAEALQEQLDRVGAETARLEGVREHEHREHGPGAVAEDGGERPDGNGVDDPQEDQLQDQRRRSAEPRDQLLHRRVAPSSAEWVARTPCN